MATSKELLLRPEIDSSMPHLLISIYEQGDIYSEDLKSKLEFCWPQNCNLRQFKEPAKFLKLLDWQIPHVLFIDSIVGESFLRQLKKMISSSSCHLIFTYNKGNRPDRRDFGEWIETDYLEKPILISSLNEIYDRLISRLGESQFKAKNSNFFIPDRILLRAQNGIRFVAPDDIILCKALDNYTSFYLVNNEKRIISKSLKKVEQLLDPYHFFRSHQSYLVNLKHLKEFVRTDGGKLLLKDGIEAYLAKSKKELLFKLMQNFSIEPPAS